MDKISSSGAYDAGTFHAITACELAWAHFFVEAPVTKRLAVMGNPRGERGFT
jgi:hypothetical protein